MTAQQTLARDAQVQDTRQSIESTATQLQAHQQELHALEDEERRVVRMMKVRIATPLSMSFHVPADETAPCSFLQETEAEREAAEAASKAAMHALDLYAS